MFGDVPVKIIAYYIIHYGREWLNWSMRSVVPYVSETHVFYTESPSHGHGTNLKNPESRIELKSIADYYGCVWHDGIWQHEGFHRDFALATCYEAGADMVLIVDADELWPPDMLHYLLEKAEAEQDAMYWRVPMIHFWRSLHWAIFDDKALPMRLHNKNGSEERYLDDTHGSVLHMGYAQSLSIIKYKQSIHGHKAEWRERWFEDIFRPWSPGVGDVHPTNVNYWNPKFIDPLDFQKFEPLFRGHPYLRKGLIR